MCVPGGKSRVRPSLSKRAGGGERELESIVLLLPAQKSSWSTTSSSAGGEGVCRREIIKSHLKNGRRRFYLGGGWKQKKIKQLLPVEYRRAIENIYF